MMKIFVLLTFFLFPQVLFAELQQINVEAKLKANNEVQIILSPPSHWIDSQSKVMTIDEAVLYFDRMMLMNDGGTINFISNGVDLKKLMPVIKMIQKNAFLHFLRVDGKLFTADMVEKVA